MNLILFGFKGVGKTTTGKMIARYINCPFFDTDELLEQRLQKRVSTLYTELGSLAFREEEKKTVLSLKSVTGSVIAVGGGTVLDFENVRILQSIGKMVYLKASFETVSRRIKTPSFLDSTTSLKEVYEKRVPIYESICAEVVIGV